jgi:phage shock protein E
VNAATLTFACLLFVFVIIAVSRLAQGGVPALTPAQAEELLAREGTRAVLLDVRTPGEFADGHIRGARNLDYHGADFAAAIAQLPRDTTYVVYCHSGMRSASAARLMLRSGFATVYNVSGGYAAWRP